MTTPHNNEALEVGQEISLFDCRWKIEGIHLGALGQESLIELKSLTHKAGWTGQWEYHPMVFVPEPFVRVALTRASEVSPATVQDALDDVKFIRKELGRTWINQRQREVIEDIHARLNRIESALTHPREQQSQPAIVEREIDRLASFILKGDLGHPKTSAQKPNGESAVDAAIAIITELKNKSALKQFPPVQPVDVEKLIQDTSNYLEMSEHDVRHVIDHLVSRGIIQGGKG